MISTRNSPIDTNRSTCYQSLSDIQINHQMTTASEYNRYDQIPSSNYLQQDCSYDYSNYENYFDDSTTYQKNYKQFSNNIYSKHTDEKSCNRHINFNEQCEQMVESSISEYNNSDKLSLINCQICESKNGLCYNEKMNKSNNLSSVQCAVNNEMDKQNIFNENTFATKQTKGKKILKQMFMLY